MDDAGKEGASLPDFPEEEKWGEHTSEVLRRHREQIRPVFYLNDMLHSLYEPLPYFDFSRTSVDEQHRIMQELHSSALADEKQLFLEVGPGERLSPLEAAVNARNRVVFAVDNSFQPREMYFRKDLASAAHKKGSFAVFFGLDANTLEERLKFDRVQMFFPSPEHQDQLAGSVSRYVKPGGDLVILVDPNLRGEPGPESIVQALPDDFSSDIRNLDWSTIHFLFGVRETEFHRHGQTPVVVATRR